MTGTSFIHRSVIPAYKTRIDCDCGTPLSDIRGIVECDYCHTVWSISNTEIGISVIEVPAGPPIQPPAVMPSKTYQEAMERNPGVPTIHDASEAPSPKKATKKQSLNHPWFKSGKSTGIPFDYSEEGDLY